MEKKCVLDAMFNFEPIKRFKKRWNEAAFRRMRHSSNCRVYNELKTIKLRTREVQKEGVAIIMFRVNTAIVWAVEWSRVFLIRWRSRLDWKQDLETAENMIRHRECRVKNDTKVTCRVSWHYFLLSLLHSVWYRFLYHTGDHNSHVLSWT